MFVYNINSLKLILRPQTGAYTQVQVQLVLCAVCLIHGTGSLFGNLRAMFSIGLAFYEFIANSGLDGGHALFTIAEMITGRKLSDKAAGYVQTAGMIILLTLMALTFGKDIYQLVVDKLL